MLVTTVHVTIISVLMMIFDVLAVKLTTREQHRTEDGFKRSYAFKVWLFNFICYGSGMFYMVRSWSLRWIGSVRLFA